MNPVMTALEAASIHLGAGHPALALDVLDALEPRLDPAGGAEARLGVQFARALRLRAGDERRGTGNLYAGATGPEEMLAAFDLLVRETPLVRFGHAAANAAIERAVRADDALHVVDLGIGFGSQWLDLLERLARRPGGPPRVRLTGVDVPVPGEDPARALREAGDRLSAAAAALGVPFTFEARPGFIEDVALAPSRPGEALVVNAAFALHHVPGRDVAPHGRRSREAVIADLRAAAPRLLVLVEPDAEHDRLPLPQRTLEAWRHYGLVFDVFDHLFGRDLPSRRALESAFFGREVENVICGEGGARVERHQRRARWQAQAEAAGFARVPLDGVRDDLAEGLGARPGFSVGVEDGALTLCWKGAPILATLAFEG